MDQVANTREPDRRPIAVFDSGVGGLSILREIRIRLPCEDLVFFADQAHVPYGRRSLSEVRNFSVRITEFLLSRNAKTVVLACNTASAAALHHLRARFPQIPFVGMEPAVKPAAAITQTRVVGVLATPATFQGELYASVVDRFAEGVEIIEVVLPGLVERVEEGDLISPVTRQLLAGPLKDLQESRVDTIVLACTHYPFLIPLIEDLVGPEIRVLDPSPAIARQTKRVLEDRGWLTSSIEKGELTLISSRNALHLKEAVKGLIDLEGKYLTVEWSPSGELKPLQ